MLLKSLFILLYSLSLILMIYSPGTNAGINREVPYEQLGYILLVTTQLFALLCYSRERIRLSKVVGIITLSMYVVMMLSSRFSLGYLASLLSLIFLFQTLTTSSIIRWSFSIVAFLLLLTLFIPFNSDFLGVEYGVYDRRYSGIVQNSTLFGVTLVLFADAANIESKILARLYYILILIAVILSGSRTALLVFLLINFRRSVKFLPIILAGILVLVDDVYDKVYTFRRVLSAKDYNTLGGRSDKFSEILDITSGLNLGEQLFGFGYGNYDSLGLSVGAHSNWMRVIVEFGIVGLVSLIMVYLMFTIIIINRGRYAALVLILIDATMPVHFSLSYLWILLLFIMTTLSTGLNSAEHRTGGDGKNRHLILGI